jgi:TolB-like protein
VQNQKPHLVGVSNQREMVVADVFVSYSAKDRDRVAPLIEALQTSGLSVWWDRGIDVGSRFDREIERELDAAGCVVVVWSTESIESEWVRNEALEAQSRDALVPMLIEDVKPPLAFRREQTARMFEWPQSHTELDVLLRAVRAKLARLRPDLGSRTAHGLVATSTRADAPSLSIAVIPLVNVSPDPEQEHFVDGLTLELIHRLAKIPNLRVAGQGFSFQYKSRRVNYDEIRRTLSIDHLLEGSVRRAGNRLRVTVELVGTSDGFQIWSGDFDKQLDDVFAIQQEISDAVASALSINLRKQPLESLGSTDNANAYAHYLRGNALFWQVTPETTERAVAELEEAVAIEPQFARAWAQLALAYGGRARQLDRTEENLQDMRRAAERALEAEPLLDRAHAAMGWYLLSRRQFVAADLAMTEAERLGRGASMPESVTYLHQVGRWTDCLAAQQSVDPIHVSTQDALYVLGRKAEAREVFARVKGLNPPNDRSYLSMVAMDQPTADAADQTQEGFSQTPFGRAWFGLSSNVLRELHRDLVDGVRTRGDFALRAMIAAHHRDIDLAIEFLRAEYLIDGFGAFYLLWHPQLESVRISPKFKTFLIDLGLPEMWRKTGRWGDFAEPLGDDDFRCR